MQFGREVCKYLSFLNRSPFFNRFRKLYKKFSKWCGRDVNLFAFLLNTYEETIQSNQCYNHHLYFISRIFCSHFCTQNLESQLYYPLLIVNNGASIHCINERRSVMRSPCKCPSSYKMALVAGLD